MPDDTVKLMLLTETNSRYGDDWFMLPAGQEPQDGLGRVLMQFRAPMPRVRIRTCDDYDRSMDTEPAFEFPRIITGAVRSLLGESASCWIIGEVGPLLAETLARRHGGSFRRMKAQQSDDLIIWRLEPDVPTLGLALPWFQWESGACLLGFRRANTPLEIKLTSIFQHIETDRASALSEWDTIRRACLRRQGVFGICKDADLCVLPDGSHYQDASIQSSVFSIAAIIHELLAATGIRGTNTVVVRNTKDEWQSLWPGR